MVVVVAVAVAAAAAMAAAVVMIKLHTYEDVSRLDINTIPFCIRNLTTQELGTYKGSWVTSSSERGLHFKMFKDRENDSVSKMLALQA